MIFELTPDVYYQFDKKQNTWVKLAGFEMTVDVATPLADGLMSADDYKKINRLLIPPPHTTLRSVFCDIIWDSGTFGFRSNSEDIFIDFELPLVETDKNGFQTATNQVFQIHENTYGMNFRVNMVQLYQELVNRGQLRYNKRIGEQGLRGLKGLPGRDRLNTGPVGAAGANGKNSVWPGILSQSTSGVANDPNRAVVDISVEKISPTENYIVVTRGSIVNSSYCPQYVKPTSMNSKWVLAIDDRPETTTQIRECDVSEQCGFSCTGIRTLIIPFCTTKLYYFDFSEIETSISDRFTTLLEKMKSEKEKLANDWLKTMISVFSEQKLALCCALENCNTKSENKRTKEYIETQRIAAAQAGLQLVIGKKSDNANQYDANPGTLCQYPPPSTSPNTPIIDPDSNQICPALAVINLDSRVNYNNLTPVSIDMPAGRYLCEITDCCAINYNYNSWGGVYWVSYHNLYAEKHNQPDRNTYPVGLPMWHLDVEGPQHQWDGCVPGPPLGNGLVKNCYFATEAEAIASYKGNSTLIAHGGGMMHFWSGMGDKCCVNGHIQITLRDADCMNPQPGSVGVECATEPAFATDITGVPDSENYFCDINLEQILWYEYGWRTGACCGVLLEAGGTTWIVVKRSIADDVTCGGGESLNTPCIKGAYELGFHPAFAFPTIDGQVFLGKPTTVQRVIRDIDLEGEIISKLSKGLYIEIKGDPLHNFEGILFPYDLGS